MASANLVSRDVVEKILQSVIEKRGIKNPKIDIRAGRNFDDGCLTSITEVDLTGDDNKVLNLIIKMAPNMEVYNTPVLLKTSFKREIYFYNKVAQYFEEYQKLQGIPEPLVNIARCLKTGEYDNGNEYEYLVLENMKSKGFTRWNRLIQSKEDHIVITFKQYARFHAVSYAIKLLNPCLFEECTHNLEVSALDNRCLINVSKICERCFINYNTNRDLFNSIQNYLDGLKDFLDFIQNSKSKHSVILHGDGWCNNVLFTYKNNKPHEACLLDFQLCFMGSPVIDLCHFFFLSASRDNLDNYQVFARIYHEELKVYYSELGGKEKDLLTFDDLITEWKIYARYGFTMVLYIFRAMVCEKEDMFANRIMNQEGDIEELIRNLADYMNNNGFFSL